MKATVTPINRRIDLQLNVAFAFEALILNRLLHLPKDRQNEWLRGLLVLGFQSECGALKNMQGAGGSSNAATWHQNIVTQPSVSAAKSEGPKRQPVFNPETRPAGIQALHSGRAVSFAALRKVIG